MNIDLDKRFCKKLFKGDCCDKTVPESVTVLRSYVLIKYKIINNNAFFAILYDTFKNPVLLYFKSLL